MKIEVNAPGLTAEEVRQAIEDARKRKIQYEKTPWVEMRRELLEKVVRLMVLEDISFIEDILKHIKQVRPDLIDKYATHQDGMTS